MNKSKFLFWVFAVKIIVLGAQGIYDFCFSLIIIIHTVKQLNIMKKDQLIKVKPNNRIQKFQKPQKCENCIKKKYNRKY